MHYLIHCVKHCVRYVISWSHYSNPINILALLPVRRWGLSREMTGLRSTLGRRGSEAATGPDCRFHSGSTVMGRVRTSGDQPGTVACSRCSTKCHWRKDEAALTKCLWVLATVPCVLDWLDSISWLCRGLERIDDVSEYVSASETKKKLIPPND